ncbi:uncharacterized protein LOC115323152 [Ixodes scapularis]|uniref:uncharacterized protein LOC115323152 n=1 Tax=Ixodes scapularis TaxID=6945 RepID=UPI001A9EB5BF|nr:uncharacterized protein LOC115323152 [Ixodes scapularis]
MAPMKTCTVPPSVLAILFVAFFCSTREAQGQETITAPQECSGTFKVHSTQVTLLVQQRVTSRDDVVNCQYVFEAPESAGLLVFANGITAIDDGEIPGCPVTIYDGDNQQVSSLCGHYDTAVIPVSSSRVTVAYRPEYQGSPYTLTLDLQVTRSDDDTSVLCADAELHAVPSVPVKYDVVLRDDGSASDDEQVCDYKVVSNAVNETLKTGCLLTSGGDCSYEVLLSNGSQLDPAPGLISLAEVGGQVTVRLHPRSLSGVLALTLPGDFEPVFSLERPPNATEMPVATTETSDGSDVNMTDDGQDVSTPPTHGSTDGGNHDDCDHHGDHDHDKPGHGHDKPGHGHGDDDDDDVDDDDDDDDDEWEHGGHHDSDDEDESFWDSTITWIWTIEYTMVFTSYSIKSWFWSWF